MNRLPARIEAGDLVLRRWEVGDAEIQQRAVTESAAHLRPWMPWMDAEPRSPLARRGMLSRWQREWEEGGNSLLGVFLDGAVAGGCGLHRRRGPETLEIGYWVHVSFLRRGIATRAAALLTEAAFSLPGIERVEIRHDKANAASAGVPRGLGYRFDGESPDAATAPAQLGIQCTWSMRRPDWAPLS